MLCGTQRLPNWHKAMMLRSSSGAKKTDRGTLSIYPCRALEQSNAAECCEFPLSFSELFAVRQEIAPSLHKTCLLHSPTEQFSER